MKRLKRGPGWLAAVVLVALGSGVSLPVPGAAQSDGFVVIVNESNPVSSIAKKELSNFFLKKVTAWNDGDGVKPVDLGARDPVREAFSKSVHGRAANAIKSFWQRQIFSGRGTPPPEVSSEAEVMAYVASEAGGVGYVGATTPLGAGVKAISLAD